MWSYGALLVLWSPRTPFEPSRPAADATREGSRSVAACSSGRLVVFKAGEAYDVRESKSQMGNSY
jgi:hypothetical protein